jgi:hypothetical protein
VFVGQNSYFDIDRIIVKMKLMSMWDLQFIRTKPQPGIITKIYKMLASSEVRGKLDAYPYTMLRSRLCT